MGALTHNGEVLQSLPANASQINFDKTGTDLNATQVENAIKEVNGKVNTNAEDITQLKSGLTGLSNSNVLQAAPLYLAGDADLNDIIIVGVYGGNLYPSNLGHSPEPDNTNATYAKLIVSEIGSSANKVITQKCRLMTTVGTMHVYTRYLSGETWTAWA